MEQALVHDSADMKARYESIFYNRPVGPLHRKQIGILVGKHTSLHDVSEVHDVILALNHYPVIVAEVEVKQFGVPAEVFLHSRDKLRFENTDEAIARLQDCHMIVAGIGLELTAAMQLFLERVLQSCPVPIVLTESVLSFPTLENYLGEKTLLFAPTKALLKLGAAPKPGNKTGLHRKVELLQAISTHHAARLVCVESHQVLALEHSSLQVGIINSQDKISPNAYLAILVSMLADRQTPLAEGWLDFALASGHLYKTVYALSSNPPEALKTFFDFN